MVEKYLSLDEFIRPDDEDQMVFTSEVWKDSEGNPGKLKIRAATVGDREKARKAAKKGEQFDNAAYGCKLISLCVIEPKIPDMEMERLRRKLGKEMDRLLQAILGESEDPK